MPIFRSISVMILFFGLAGCSHLLYHPTDFQYVEVSSMKWKPVDHYLDFDLDTRIHLWHFTDKSRKAKATFLFFHGNAQNLSSHFASLYWLLQEGYDYVIFDYPGYGKSSGSPSPKNTVQVGQLVYDWTLNNTKGPIVLFAQSLGSVIGMRTVYELQQAGKRKENCAIVLEGSMSSYEMLGADVMSRMWLTWPFQWLAYLLLDDEWASDEVLGEISGPKLVIHGDSDEVVPIEYGKRVFQRISEPKQFITDPGGRHIQALRGPNRKFIAEGILDFVGQNCQK